MLGGILGLILGNTHVISLDFTLLLRMLRLALYHLNDLWNLSKAIALVLR